MTAMERVTREVERGLQRWCDAPLEPVVDGPDTDGEVAMVTASVRQVSTSEAVDSGIRYQRCGGGRRIIRRQRGGY